ncbi:MAG: hypothetical protein L7U87_08865 [Chlamydiales bacterium]|nr:hypothetical protein [Chlamydiales bacterium]
MDKIIATFFLVFVLFLSSCDKREEAKIKTYRLAKVPEEKLQTNQNPQSFSHSNSLWHPKNWQEIEAGFMRQALFKLKNEAKESWECSISFLPGESGSEIANINRWRKQIQLAPIREENIASFQSEYNTKLGQATIFSFLSDSDNSLAIVVAIFKDESGKHFFKMQGKNNLVKQEQENFFKFLDKLEKLTP